MIATPENIRFDSNAIAPHHHRKYYVVDGSLEPWSRTARSPTQELNNA
jgi:hypothetical protein